MRDYATRNFTFPSQGTSVERGEDVTENWDQRTRDHMRVAGWITTVPEAEGGGD